MSYYLLPPINLSTDELLFQCSSMFACSFVYISGSLLLCPSLPPLFVCVLAGPGLPVYLYSLC